MRLVPLLAVLALLALASAPAGAQSAVKIGVFDSQRISEESEEGKKIQAVLSEMGEAKQADLAAMEQELGELQQRLSQQQLSLSVERRMALELDIQRKGLELNNAKDLASRELQLEFAAAESQFNEKLRMVVTQFGMDENFSVLLEAGAVAYSATSVDVTTAIIDLFNKMYPATGE
jgi:Skp family chaperone for outer membrane proteins